MKLKIEMPIQNPSRWFEEWFDREIKPINKLLSEAVEVRSDSLQLTWAVEGSDYYFSDLNAHRAYIIGVEPLKKETLQEIAQDFVKYFHPDFFTTDDKAFKFYGRFKKALEDSECD